MKDFGSGFDANGQHDRHGSLSKRRLRHLPQFSYTGLQDKVTYGVNQVTTPFMAFAADDDFLLHRGLTESVAFLEANPDYGVCHGYGMMYLARATEVNYFRRDRKVHEDYNSELPEERVTRFMDHSCRRSMR